MLFVVALPGLWRARNDLVFRGKTHMPSHIAFDISKEIGSILQRQKDK